MILSPISLVLNSILEADDKYLPLATPDLNKLLSHVPEGEDIYLTIKDDLYTEYIKAQNQCGTIVIERGIAGTTPRRFPRGSCVFFETSLPVVQWLICNYDCCATDCPCTTVQSAGGLMPQVEPGQPWRGTAVFTGDLPMNFGVTGLPYWLRASSKSNTVILEGTAPAEYTGPDVIAVTATNCNGQGVATQIFELAIV